MSPDADTSQSRSYVTPSSPAEPWGIQALLQLIAFYVIGVLLWGALNEIKAHPQIGPLAHPESWLLRVSQHITGDLLTRLNKALEPDYRFSTLSISAGVGAWALVSVIGNLASAIILFFIAATSWTQERPLVKSVLIVVATSAVFLSVLATPFLFSILTSSAGRHLPLDAAMVSVLIYLAYLVVNCLFLFDRTEPSIRNSFLVFIAAVDLPCFLTTAIFIGCNLFVGVPPEFSVGVTAALLTYYSLAFFLLCGVFWLRTANGEALMKALRGRVAIAIAVGAALNGAIGFLVQLVKLPLYLDLVGSIFVALVFGPIAGIFAAILGSVIVGLLTTPLFIAYVGTAVGVTVAAAYLKRFNYGTRFWPTILLGGLILGPLSSVLSIPITTYLFSGVTFTGSDLITALFANTMGTTLLTSVAAGAFIFDAADKALASLLSYWLYRSAPKRLVP